MYIMLEDKRDTNMFIPAKKTKTAQVIKCTKLYTACK